jgi:hypothetical protein
MIYLENDFYSNFNSMVESNDDVSLNSMFVDQISNLIAFKKNDLISLFGKIGIKVSNNPSNKELANIIAKNLKGNKKLQIGIAYLIAENNDILQQEFKKARPSDDTDAFEGEKDKEKPKKPRKPIDINKATDTVTSIAGTLSVLADTLTQAKTGRLAEDLNNQSNVKSPEDIAKEQEAKSLADKKKRKRNIIIGVVILALGVTAFIGYKKGWFVKKVN